jgi:prostaglandin-endoperoxide synthase 2
MGSFIEDFALEALTAAIGHDEANEFLINRLVKKGRGRPHPWSTLNDYISWTGLTDRSYNARLLPENPYPPLEKLGTRKPPIDDVAKLFSCLPGKQRADPKSTALFPAFAQYLTDGFIRTRIFNDASKDERKRTTSNHEIDMSPLYGRTPAQTAVLREKPAEFGRKGRLKTDESGAHIMPRKLFGADGKVKPEFCDPVTKTPVLDEPLGISHANDKASLFAVGGDRANATPAVAAINLLFLREHNRLADKLAAANPNWDDDRVFETARNIIIVMFIKIVVEEYINHINTSVFKFRADPQAAWKADWNRPNWMTAEFSLLYRWHSLTAETLSWGGQTKPGTAFLLDNKPLIADGLAGAFVEISANNAAALGLGNSAAFLFEAEQHAVKQARLNNIDTYNAYRRAMDMDPAEEFEDLVGKTKDPAEKARRAAIAAELKRLYGTVDNVEFYVGLFAEPANKNGPLPDLILAMVAMDAFSQALTNPLLSRHIWGNAANKKLAFTEIGLEAIADTKKLRDVLVRNSTNLGDRFVGMTRRDWKRD